MTASTPGSARERPEGEPTEAPRWAPWLSRAGWILFALAVALILRRELFSMGWIAEDFVQAAMVEGWWSTRRVAFELYSLAPRDPELRARHLEIGALPWWTPASFKFAPLRPLASLDVWLSHTLFPGAPWLHHAHSALWLGLYLAAATRLTREWFGEWPARLGVVLLALDASLLLPLVWTANRGVLLTGTFVAMAMARHLSRHGGLQAGAQAARWDGRECLWWCLAFGTGEYALVGIAMLATWSGLAGPIGLRAKLRGLVPAAVATCGYVVAYAVLGAGIAGHALYDGPIERPWVWLAALPTRWLALVCDAFSGVPLDPIAPWSIPWQLAALLPWPLLLVWWGIRVDRTSRRLVLAAVVGVVVGVVPLTAVVGSSRLLVVPAILVCALSGRLVVDLVDALSVTIRGVWSAPASRTGLGRALPWIAVAIDTVFAASLLFRAGLEGFDTHVRSEWMARLDEEEHERWAHPGLRELSGKDVIVVSAPDSYTAIFGMAVLGERAKIRPRRVFVLTQTPEAILLRRSKSQRLVLDILGEGFDMRDRLEPLFWRAPLGKGDVVDAGPLHVRVGATNAHGGIGRLDVGFASRVPLDDAVLLVFEGRAFVPRAMPPVGGQLIIPARGGRTRPPGPR
jgi:hypothetical protein